MEAHEAREKALLGACMDHLRALPFVLGARAQPQRARDEGFDAKLLIETPRGQHVLYCEVKSSHLATATAQYVVARARKRPDFLVCAPSVGPNLGQFFERAHVNFVDAAGNLYLRLGDEYVARVQGQKPTRTKPGDRGLRAAGYRVIFALLVQPTLLREPTRHIAGAADVSPQTAANVLHQLSDRGLIVRRARSGKWAPGRRKDAIAMWLSGFQTALAPSLLVGRFRPRETDPAAFETRIEPLLDSITPWRYGGGAAAMRLAHHYRGDRTVLYVAGPETQLAARLQLVPDASGPVLIARSPGPLAFESPDPRSVHPLLAYADLVAEGHSRALEAADVLHERFISEMERDA